MMTSDSSIKWIESLAEQESLISSGHKAGLDLSQTKEEVMAVSTAVYFRQLHTQFEYLVRLFNSHVSETSLGIRLLRENEKFDSFSLQRNETRLTISGNRPGFVHLQCEKVVGDTIQNSRPSVIFSGILEARYAAFDEVEWYFLGSAVSTEQVARHYLTEFIQTSHSPQNLI